MTPPSVGKGCSSATARARVRQANVHAGWLSGCATPGVTPAVPHAGIVVETVSEHNAGAQLVGFPTLGAQTRESYIVAA